MKNINLGRNYTTTTIDNKDHVDQHGNGPGMWQALLADMKEKAPDTEFAVAGGAVRDYVLGLPPKDIDLFAFNSQYTAPVLFEADLSALVQGREANPAAEVMFASGSDGAFFGINIENKALTNYPIQCIIGSEDKPASDVREILDRFDYGLVRAAFTLDSPDIIQCHKDFVADSPTGKFTFNKTLTRPSESKVNARNRYLRWKKRTMFGLVAPTEWVENTGKKPDVSAYDPDVYALEVVIGRRLGADMRKVTALRNVLTYRWELIGTSDVLRHRLVDKVLLDSR